MTDKQIIENKNGFYCIEPCCEIKQLKEQLKAKEQECEKWEEINKYSQDKLLEQVKVVCKLKQTLTEIKEIIHFNKTNRLSGGACISIEQILQKINEVESEYTGKN